MNNHWTASVLIYWTIYRVKTNKPHFSVKSTVAYDVKPLVHNKTNWIWYVIFQMYLSAHSLSLPVYEFMSGQGYHTETPRIYEIAQDKEPNR